MHQNKKVMTLGELIVEVNDAAKGNLGIACSALEYLCRRQSLKVIMKNVRDRRIVVTH